MPKANDQIPADVLRFLQDNNFKLVKMGDKVKTSLDLPVELKDWIDLKGYSFSKLVNRLLLYVKEHEESFGDLLHRLTEKEEGEE